MTVQADGVTVIREGHGTGEGRGPSPGEVHDIAVKAAETDGTKRALATFGRPFGLALYWSWEDGRPRSDGHAAGCRGQRFEFPLGRHHPYPAAVALPWPRAICGNAPGGSEQGNLPAPNPADEVSIVPAGPDLLPAKIDKSALTIPRKRWRSWLIEYHRSIREAQVQA